MKYKFENPVITIHLYRGEFFVVSERDQTCLLFKMYNKTGFIPESDSLKKSHQDL